MVFTGSILYLFPPVGSLIASLVQDSLGHRKCMILANISHLLSIVILLLTNTSKLLYVVTALMGFNVGFLNSVTISYCGEVCDPKLRGILSSVSSLFYFAGDLFITTSYAITADWKLSVLFTLTIPIVNAVFLFQVSTFRWILNFMGIHKFSSRTSLYRIALHILWGSNPSRNMTSLLHGWNNLLFQLEVSIEYVCYCINESVSWEVVVVGG